MPPKRQKRPRRKAKQDRARETVEVVLEAAARVLLERGYASATTNRIAEAAGVSVGTVYEYFADKEEVFAALIEREIGRIVAAMAEHTAADGLSLGEHVARILAATMDAMVHGPELFRRLEQVPGAALRRRLASARGAVVLFVRGILEAHRDELRVGDLDRAAFLLVSAAEGVGGNASRELFDDRLRAELAAMLSLYLTGSATPRSAARSVGRGAKKRQTTARDTDPPGAPS